MTGQLDPSEKVKQRLRARNTRVRNLGQALYHRCLVPAGQEHVDLACLCLQDLGDLMVWAGKSVSLAEREWSSSSQPPDGIHLMRKVARTRYYGDYAAVTLSAASNHLASAMWHLHERVERPLGNRYKTAAQVVCAWSHVPTPPESLGIIRRLLGNSAWKAVGEYRDQWVHRGLPLIAGERRRKRTTVWRDEGAQPPLASFGTVKRANGKVAYIGRIDHPQYTAEQLLRELNKAHEALMDASEEFLPLIDVAFAAEGIIMGKGDLPPSRDEDSSGVHRD